MVKHKINPQIDNFLNTATKWQPEMTKLRTILLDTGLEEELKWGKPCYVFHSKNIVLIQGFKAYCALLFFKGYLLPDPKGILVKTGEKTRVGRQIRFSNFHEIEHLEVILKDYVNEAIMVEQAELLKK